MYKRIRHILLLNAILPVVERQYLIRFVEVFRDLRHKFYFLYRPSNTARRKKLPREKCFQRRTIGNARVRDVP